VEAVVRTTVAALAVGLALLMVGVLAARSTAERSLEPTAEERSAALETVRALLSLTAHLRGSGGDPRFAERIPAAAPVREELQRDAEFTLHLGVLEEARLVQLDVRGVRRVAPGRLEVDTTEYWVTRTLPRGGEAPGTRSDVVLARYVVGRQPGGWVVLDWELAPGVAAPGGS
jgi:hypothetical protein